MFALSCSLGRNFFNQNGLFAQSCVIPAQAGIQMIKKFPAKRGNIFVRFVGCLSLLDSRLRGNDGKWIIWLSLNTC